MEKKSVAVTNEKVSNYIPKEISYSILSKLPLKSLKRFQCVQKSWSLLFENHHFMKMFLNKFLSYNDPASLILSTIENREGVFYHLSGERFENKVKLDWSNSFRLHDIYSVCVSFVSVNGWFCLYNECVGSTVLWNPATQTIKLLPPSEVQLVDLCREDEDYVGYNDYYYYVQGFGYDNVINNYKLIRYVNVYEDSLGGMIDPNIDFVWEIYSLRSNSWRKLHVDMPYSLKCAGGTRVDTDGVCHWLCEDSKTVGPCLVSFYLNNEEFLITLIPSDVDTCFDTKASWINLAVLNQSIALISYHEETTIFHISILSEFGTKESWTKLLIVGPLSYVERPIGVGTKGEIFFIRKDEELVWLDLSTQMIAELGYRGADRYSWVIIYKDSIPPIEGISSNCFSCFHQDL